MSELAFRLAVAAGKILRSRDLRLVEALHDAEQEMDCLHRSLFAVLSGRELSYGVSTAVEAVLLCRYYERFADHAVSVARRTGYLVTGEWTPPSRRRQNRGRRRTACDNDGSCARVRL